MFADLWHRISKINSFFKISKFILPQLWFNQVLFKERLLALCSQFIDICIRTCNLASQPWFSYNGYSRLVLVKWRPNLTIQSKLLSSFSRTLHRTYAQEMPKVDLGPNILKSTFDGAVQFKGRNYG